MTLLSLASLLRLIGVLSYTIGAQALLAIPIAGSVVDEYLIAKSDRLPAGNNNNHSLQNP